MTKRPWVIHPFLLAAFPTVYLYSKNLRIVDGSEALAPLGLSLAATALGFLMLRAFRLDGSRSGLILSAALLLFFSFSHGIRLLDRWHLGSSRVAREQVVLIGEGIALASAVGLVLGKPAFARAVNTPVNASSVALVAMTLFGTVVSEWGAPVAPEPRVTEPVGWGLSNQPVRRPDVYLLILDAYGRSDVLKSMFGFDNAPMLERLERRGFVVARSSRSNYCQTALSLAATLNLRYLDEFAGNPTDDRRPLRRMIADNLVFRAFRDQGYRLVTFASGFDATESFPSDLNLAPPGNLRSFHALIADQTPLWLFLGQQASREPHRRHRDRILNIFDEIPVETHPSTSPTFTFAHVLSPHPPFVFGADGGDLSAREASYSMSDSDGWRGIPGHAGADDYASRYREQATFLTRRVEQAVDRILATSSSPPIILIQGDHGPGSRFDSSQEQPNDVVERFGIINACLVPEATRGQIVDGITPINTLRAVVNECLGAKLELLPDRSFHSSFAKPYLFTEVTAELR